MDQTLQKTSSANGLKKPLRVAELFAGIGGFGLALTRLGHKIVYVNEWDKYAAQTYEKNFSNQGRGALSGEERQHERDNVYSESIGEKAHNPIRVDTRSITDVPSSEIPDHDLLCGGFPCQAFSIAGKRGGFNDTRGTLFFEIARILKDKRPPLILLENVKGLLSHDNGRTFETIMRTLDELGYSTQWQVLNSKNFGVPQNRERVFIIGHLGEGSAPQIFPIKLSDTDLTQGNQKGEDRVADTITTRYAARNGRGTHIAHTLDANYYKGIRANQARTGVVESYPIIRIENKNGQGFLHENETGTIRANASRNYQTVIEGVKIRRLTPIECERLQGFPDGWTEWVSDTQRYKQLGNAVTVNVVQAIAERLVS